LSKDTRQFVQFVAVTLGLGLIAGMVLNEKWPQGFALPFGLAWIAAFLAATGLIFGGKEGAKALLSSTLLMWTLAAIGALLISWMAIAGAGHSL
jgi:hypothetical protein